MTTTSELMGARASARSSRLWEVDALRGVAIIMMVIYHLMWDLWYFQVFPDVELYAGFWKYFQRTTATLFISLVGLSLTISYRRGKQNRRFRKFLVRGVRIFGWGMVISLVVWSLGIGVVHFGILHLIGFSIVAAFPFLTWRWPNLGLWLVFFAAGYFLQTASGGSVWLAWLGLPPQYYAAIDYFPVIPWFGVVLLGIFVGNVFYTDTGCVLSLPDLSGWLPIRGLQFLGRHSLVIYLVHQPLLFLILLALGIAHIG